MSPEVRDAIECARTVGRDGLIIHRAEPQRRRSFQAVRATVLAVAQDLPADMTLGDLCDELHIAENQFEQETE